MQSYVVRRVAQFLPVLLVGAIVVWGMTYALPGDPATVLAGENATADQIAAIQNRLALDRPVWEQFGTWFAHALQGDLGDSYSSGRAVGELLVDRFPATLQLAAFAMFLVIILSIPIGMLVALRPGRRSTRLIDAFLAISLAAPSFWIGVLLILAFSVKNGLLPSASVFVPFWEDPTGALRNTVMPSVAIALHASSVTARFVASSLSEVMNSDFVRMARAKGASEGRVIFRHALRNALLPTVTMVGLQLGALLGGVIVIEVVFTYPGLGRLLYSAIDTRDYALLQGAVLVVLVVFLVVNLAVDLAYALLDPRIRLS